MDTQKTEMDLMHDIAYELRKYVPGSLGWIARQMSIKDRTWSDEYAIQIGKGVACVSVNEAKNADDALIRKLAEQILGYPVDSEQDIQRRLDEAEENIADLTAQLKRIMDWLAYWNDKKLKLVAQQINNKHNQRGLTAANEEA